MAEEKKSPLKAISFMMIITLAGKLTGLFRDRLLTVNYGTAMAANAFLTASRIPRVFFDAVFASAISACFIPVFNEYMVKKGKKEAFSFSCTFITVIGLFSVLLTMLGCIFAPQLTELFAGGFDADTAALCTELTRIMFPTVICTGIAFSFVGILQSLDEFNVPAAISLVSNAAIILYYFTFNDTFGITGLAVVFTIAWLLQALVQIPSLKKRGFKFTPSFAIGSEGMKKVFTLMLPVLVSTWVAPVNQTINARFGSELFGGSGVSAIELSYNLYTIIVGVFILSITNYIFPKLSQLSADKDKSSAKNVIGTTMHVSMYIVIPMMLGLMSLSENIVDFIYGGGKFDAFSVKITSKALFYMCLGMVGYAVQAVLSRAFFAEQKGQAPLFAGIVSIAVNIILCFLLVDRFDVAGLAIASAASSTVNAVILTLAVEKNGLGFTNGGFVKDMIKMAAAALFMFAAVKGCGLILPDGVGKLIGLCIPVFVGVCVYYIATLALGVWESGTVLGFVKSKLIRR